MLLVSVLSIASSGSAGQAISGVMPSTCPFDEPSSLDRYDSGDATPSWDWASYADDDGFVDVIIVRGQRSQASGLMDSPSFGSEANSMSGLPSALEGSVSRLYSRAIDGMAARVSLDALRNFEEESTGIRVYPDLEVKTMSVDNIAQIGASEVWSLKDDYGDSVTGLGVVIAVIDTGIYYDHPDLGGGFGSSYKVIGGYDFFNDDPDPVDDNGHGTHVAGIVAASGGVSGVAQGRAFSPTRSLEVTVTGASATSLPG